MTRERGAVCPQCWTWYGPEVATCSLCGVPLRSAQAATDSSPQQHGAGQGAPPPADGGTRSIRGRRLPALLALVLVLLVVGFFGLPQLGLWGNPGCGFTGATCTRVLFIGDSYTYVNDLPTTFADLAWAGGHRVETGQLATGGGTLADHAADPATTTTLGSTRWDTVVLQDQSENPSLAPYRRDEMYPAARQLVAMARKVGAQPLFFLTWAHQEGWPEAGLTSYAVMQSAVDNGYAGIASQLGVPIAPVGEAWRAVVSAPSGPSLWQADGVHPTTSGTYLAACVFYASVFRQTPVGLSYRDGIPGTVAVALQRPAASTVLGDPTKWGLP